MLKFMQKDKNGVRDFLQQEERVIFYKNKILKAFEQPQVSPKQHTASFQLSLLHLLRFGKKRVIFSKQITNQNQQLGLQKCSKLICCHCCCNSWIAENAPCIFYVVQINTTQIIYFQMKDILFLAFFLILPNYIFAYDTTLLSTCIGNCTSGCSLCSNSTCSRCQLGYTLNSGSNSCSSNACLIANCAACSINGSYCLKCSDKYSVFSASSSTCVQSCSLSNCAKCVAGSSSCLVCNSGYTVYSLTNQCIKLVISNCSVMFDFRNQQYRCTLCTAGYKPSSDQTQCIVNMCSTITDCQTCAASSICDRCRIGYSWANNTCLPNSCNVSNCLYCNSTKGCIRCQSSYTLNNNQCVAQTCAIANCSLCKSGSIYCDSCTSGFSYSIWDKTCATFTLKSQPINCQIVQPNKLGTFICIKCLPGFMFAIGSQVTCISACPSNCKNCSTQTLCTTCSPGYSLLNGSCIKIVCVNSSSCKLCDQNQACLQCLDSYSQFNYVSMSCTQFCSLPNCQKCQVNSKTCELCSPGYALYSWNGSCVYSVIKNCIVLHDWRFQQFQCTRCATGYKPSQDQTQCILGYCKSIVDCQICPVSSICSQCRIGYSFTNNQCLPNSCNVTNCLYCNQQGVCLRPTSNYSLGGENGLTAAACKLPNCSSCKQSSMFCDTCAKGFAFDIWSKTCEVDPNARTGPNLKYLWLLSIGVVIIVAVILLIWVYQKGKNIDNSNRVSPKIPDGNTGTPIILNEKDTFEFYHENMENSPPLKGPIRLPPIKKAECVTPSQDQFQSANKANLSPDPDMT